MKNVGIQIEDGFLRILHCKKDVYWNQGMRYAMSYAAKHAKPGDDILLVNDDVVFYEDSIDTLMKRRKRYVHES